ncbi:MAG: sigma 54-interacting transcriptional regulator [Tenuifilaceae bacterium]
MGRRKKQPEVVEVKGRFSHQEIENKVITRRILTGREVQERLEKTSQLVLVSNNQIERLANLFSQSKVIIFLSDEEGCVVHIDGNSNLIESVKDDFLIPGSFPNEESIIAKSIGTALIDANSSKFEGSLKNQNGAKSWTALGSPIIKADGETIGSLILCTESKLVSEHTIFLLNQVANSIEHEFNFYQKELENIEVKKYFSAVFNQHPYANLTIDNNGLITHISRQAATFFGVLENELVGVEIAKIIPNWSDLWVKISQGIKVENLNIDLSNTPISASFLLSIAPVTLPDGRFEGAILAFRDLKKVYTVVNRYSGNWASYTFNDLIGVSAQFKKTVELAKKVAIDLSPILITGEVGIGKEVFAQAIHNASSRSECGFVKASLQLIPQNEIECELFGFEEGVFPGEKRAPRPGKIELAHGGTLYIDQICLLPFSLQDKLLAAIRKGVITRVGGSKQIKIDVRIITATNRDLRQLIQEGKFKLDLFYMLTENTLAIPPLRERRHDVPLFIKHYLKVKAREQKKEEPVIPKKIVRILARYEWPQNIREVEKMMDFVVSVDGKIGHDVKNEREFKKKYLFIKQREDVDSIRTIEDLEKVEIKKALDIMKSNMSKAARKLGVSRNTLYLKCKRYGIDF